MPVLTLGALLHFVLNDHGAHVRAWQNATLVCAHVDAWYAYRDWD